jgi:hypothetical protein
LERKTKSSQLLWDRCGTSYPQVLADETQFKDLAGKTRSSCPAVGRRGTSHAHVRAGRWRCVTPFACRCGREADSPAGDQHRCSHSDRSLNDWHDRAVLRDLRRKRLPLATDTSRRTSALLTATTCIRSALASPQAMAYNRARRKYPPGKDQVRQTL